MAAEDLQESLSPAQALPPGLGEGYRLLVIEDSGRAIAGLDAPDRLVNRELDILGQQVVRPAAGPIEQLLAEEEPGSRNSAARTTACAPG